MGIVEWKVENDQCYFQFKYVFIQEGGVKKLDIEGRIYVVGIVQWGIDGYIFVKVYDSQKEVIGISL